MKLLIADKKIKSETEGSLEKIAEVLWFETEDICYSAISGHADVFFCKVEDVLVVAPNCPTYALTFLDKHKVNYVLGYEKVGAKFPETAKYNALINSEYLIHNLNYTDNKILELAEERNLKLINIRQAYTRCTTVFLNNNSVLTSDDSICKKMRSLGFDVLQIKSKKIKLEGFEFGFIGGCVGVFENKIVFTSSLKNIELGEEIKLFCNLVKLEIIELDNKDMTDVGGLIFL